MAPLLRSAGCLGAFLLFVGAFAYTTIDGSPHVARARPVRVALGKLLFFDPVLSANGKRSCASCHRPEKAFTDHRITSRAFRLTANLTANAPTLLNAADQTAFFHDGRAASLEAVTAAVLTHPQEFNCSYDTVVARLRTSPAYDSLFRAAFGTRPDSATLNRALATYVASLRATAAPFDHAQAGAALLTPAARAGWDLFRGAAGCRNCHSGRYFRDERRHETAPGVWRRTPTLRNVAVTPPYRADGSAPSLTAAFTDGFHRAHQPVPLQPAQIEALVRFLTTLTDTTSADHSVPHALPWLPAWPVRRVGGQY